MIKHPSIEVNQIIFLFHLDLIVDGCKVSKEIIPDPPDVLSKTKCLEALAALRHAKWFQVCIYFPSFTIVLSSFVNLPRYKNYLVVTLLVSVFSALVFSYSPSQLDPMLKLNSHCFGEKHCRNCK